MEDVFIFDSGFDLIAWGDRALIKNSTAFEAMFLNATVRLEGARRAASALARRITVVNAAELDEVNPGRQSVRGAAACDRAARRPGPT